MFVRVCVSACHEVQTIDFSLTSLLRTVCLYGILFKPNCLHYSVEFFECLCAAWWWRACVMQLAETNYMAGAV